MIDAKWTSDWIAHLGIEDLQPLDQLAVILGELVAQIEAHQAGLPFIGNHALINLANVIATSAGLLPPFKLDVFDGGGILLHVFHPTGGGTVALVLPRPLITQGSWEEKQHVLDFVRSWVRHIEQKKCSLFVKKCSQLLSERQRNILLAMLEMHAFDSDSRQNTADIAAKAEGSQANPENFKQPIATLVKAEYLRVKRGKGGGCWLTEAGRRRAEDLSQR